MGHRATLTRGSWGFLLSAGQRSRDGWYPFGTYV